MKFITNLYHRVINKIERRRTIEARKKAGSLVQVLEGIRKKEYGNVPFSELDRLKILTRAKEIFIESGGCGEFEDSPLQDRSFYFDLAINEYINNEKIESKTD